VSSLAKAESILGAAKVCLQADYYDSAISRAYYAMFWAAIAALELTGVAKAGETWSHGGLASTFGLELIKRRRLIPKLMGRRLRDAYALRTEADYKLVRFSYKQAQRVVNWASEFIDQVRRLRK